MEQYSTKVMEHFAQPHNVGEIDDARFKPKWPKGTKTVNR